MLQQRSPSHPLATPISPIHLVQQHDGDKRLASSPVMLPSQLTFQQSSLFPPTNHIRPSKSSQIITPYSEQMTFYQSLLKELIANKNGHPFLHPVDPENMGIPEYSDVIVHPMNLLAIKKNLDSNKYEANIDQAAYDLFLVIDNCYRFNPPGLDVSLAAEFLHKLIVRRLKSNPVIPYRVVTLFTSTHPKKYVLPADPNVMNRRAFNRRKRRAVESQPGLNSDGTVSRSKESLEAWLLTVPELEPLDRNYVPQLSLKLFCLPKTAMENVISTIKKISHHSAIDISEQSLQFNLYSLHPVLLRYIWDYCDLVMKDISTKLPSNTQNMTLRASSQEEKAVSQSGHSKQNDSESDDDFLSATEDS